MNYIFVEMSEQVKVYKLSQISKSITNTINSFTQGRMFWVQGEISQIKHSGGGHLYLELVEEQNGFKQSVFQGVIWSIDYRDIKSRLGAEVDQVLERGKEIVFLTLVDYHPVYGLKLIIKDINLAFNLGQIELRKKQTIESLTKSGIIGLNAQVPAPLIWQQIALIAAPGSAGLEDFKRQLTENKYGYTFNVDIYAATVQGDKATASLLAALNKIDVQQYDVVIVLRGGGSKLDLDVFNQEELCTAFCHLEIPLVTAIGHETDTTVSDMVAYKSEKTPTAAAQGLIQRMLSFESDLEYMNMSLINQIQSKIQKEEQVLNLCKGLFIQIPEVAVYPKRGKLVELLSALQMEVFNLVSDNKLKVHKVFNDIQRAGRTKVEVESPNALAELTNQLQRAIKVNLANQQSRLGELEQKIEFVDPQKVLNRGYAVLTKKDKVIVNPNQIEEEDHIRVELKEGVTQLKIKKNG